MHSSFTVRFLFIVVFILQSINLLLSGFGTGTQGSYDSYLISVIIGFILGIVLAVINKKCVLFKNEIMIVGVGILVNILLFIDQIPFLKYVLIGNRKISDVLANTINLDISYEKPQIVERILPVIIMLLILESLVIFIGRLRKIVKKET